MKIDFPDAAGEVAGKMGGRDTVRRKSEEGTRKKSLKDARARAL